MEISVGEQRVQKIFKGNQCVSIGIPKDNLLLHLDSIGMTNSHINRDVFKDLSGNDRHVPLTNFNFDNTNGWLPNNLHFNGNRCYGEYDFIDPINNYTLSISFHIPNNGGLVASCPCINGLYTINTDLVLEPNAYMGEIRVANVIKPNTFYNVVLAYRDGSLDIYVNGVKKKSLTSIGRSTNTILSLGRVGSTYREFMFHSLQFYSDKLPEEDIIGLYKLESSRYIVYHDKNLVLDVRGYNQLIKYGGFVSIRDNSIRQNHIRCNEYWMLHYSRTRGISMNGMNDMAIVGRHLLNGSFTIEFMVSRIKYLFADEVLFVGKFKENEYGIQISFDNDGLLIKLHSEENPLVYHYRLNYTNKRIHIALTYDRYNRRLVAYYNGNVIKSFNNVEYIHNIDDTSILFCRKEGQLGFVGDINSIRIYNKVLSPDIIQTNYLTDMSIYR